MKNKTAKRYIIIITEELEPRLYPKTFKTKDEAARNAVALANEYIKEKKGEKLHFNKKHMTVFDAGRFDFPCMEYTIGHVNIDAE